MEFYEGHVNVDFQTVEVVDWQVNIFSTFWVKEKFDLKKLKASLMQTTAIWLSHGASGYDLKNH